MMHFTHMIIMVLKWSIRFSSRRRTSCYYCIMIAIMTTCCLHVRWRLLPLCCHGGTAMSSSSSLSLFSLGSSSYSYYSSVRRSRRMLFALRDIHPSRLIQKRTYLGSSLSSSRSLDENRRVNCASNNKDKLVVRPSGGHGTLYSSFSSSVGTGDDYCDHPPSTSAHELQQQEQLDQPDQHQPDVVPIDYGRKVGNIPTSTQLEERDEEQEGEWQSTGTIAGTGTGDTMQQQQQQYLSSSFSAPPSTMSSSYSKNPTITTTALAHLLWSHVLIPGVDIAIDATCGNGGDSIVLAQLLFGQSQQQRSTSTPSSSASTSIPHHQSSQAHLICIDQDPKACQKTKEVLDTLFSSDIVSHQIHVETRSHTPFIPLLSSSSFQSARIIKQQQQSIGLVVYNLGYLPGSKQSSIPTQTYTTIQSIMEAAPYIRVGGMISIMTYPRTNPIEDIMVRTFLEGLALFSSATKSYTDLSIRDPILSLLSLSSTSPSIIPHGNWFDEITTPPTSTSVTTTTTTTTTTIMKENKNNNITNNDAYILQMDQWLQSALQSVYTLNPMTTWRVYQHDKIGWTNAPILITAARIK